MLFPKIGSGGACSSMGAGPRAQQFATAAQFNRSQQSDGIGFITKEPRTVGEFLLQREGNMVRIPRERESSHFMMIGDTGAGKSSLIRQILMQVEGRGETAIVYDPALEYTPQFYEPGTRRCDLERGRCTYALLVAVR